MNRLMARAVLIAFSFGLAAVGAAGCLKARAQTPAPPPLNVPDAPERINIPVKPDPQPVVEPPAAVIDKPAVTQPAASSKPKPTPAPTPATPPPAQPPAGDPPPAPVAVATTEWETKARDRLIFAEREIQKVRSDGLPRVSQEQYDSAKRFIAMANRAVVVKNFVYAYYCADKAATLAELLLKRA